MNKNRKSGNIGIIVSAVVITALLLFSVTAILLYFVTAYLPLLLTGLVFIMPAFINLVLYIPVPTKISAPEKVVTQPTDSPVPFLKKLSGRIIRLLRKIRYLTKSGLVYLAKKTYRFNSNTCSACYNSFKLCVLENSITCF